MTPRCSLIIRCRNEERHIGRLLTGVMRQTVREVEIIVVDSGSTDATLEIARRFPVTVVSIPAEEFSFGRALNIGCRAARGALLVLVSAHAYPVHRDWLEQLLAPFAAEEGVALVYGKQRGDARTRFAEHRVFAQWFPERGAFPQDHPFCNNANAAIRRDVWERFPYDEGVTGLEDLAWARRVMAAGFAVVYRPEAEVIHVHEESWGRLLHRYRREAIALKAIVPEERFGILDALRLWLVNVAGDAAHAARLGVLGREFLGIVMFRGMQFIGTWLGFRQAGPVPSALWRKFYYPPEPENPIVSEGGRSRIDYGRSFSEDDS